jgi:hypothetical protein
VRTPANFELKKEEIQELGLNAIRDFFKVDPRVDLDANTLHIIHSKAKIAMQFEREMNLSERSVELNYLRVFRLVAEDRKELKRLIKKSLPKYLP